MSQEKMKIEVHSLFVEEVAKCPGVSGWTACVQGQLWYGAPMSPGMGLLRRGLWKSLPGPLLSVGSCLWAQALARGHCQRRRCSSVCAFPCLMPQSWPTRLITADLSSDWTWPQTLPPDLLVWGLGELRLFGRWQHFSPWSQLTLPCRAITLLLGPWWGKIDSCGTADPGVGKVSC